MFCNNFIGLEKSVLLVLLRNAESSFDKERTNSPLKKEFLIFCRGITNVEGLKTNSQLALMNRTVLHKGYFKFLTCFILFCWWQNSGIGTPFCCSSRLSIFVRLWDVVENQWGLKGLPVNYHGLGVYSCRVKRGTNRAFLKLSLCFTGIWDWQWISCQNLL